MVFNIDDYNPKIGSVYGGQLVTVTGVGFKQDQE